MAKRAALRKVVKWGGLLVVVLLAIVWVGSCWYRVSWARPNFGYVDLLAGRFEVREPLGPMGLGSGGVLWYPARNTKMAWWFAWDHLAGRWYVAVPLWIPLLIVAGTTAYAWRADARARGVARMGSCPACGYDRRGLEAGRVCPECGAASRGESMAKPDA